MSFIVKKAKREKLRAAIGLIGASGSGKTLGGLLAAYGMMEAKYPEVDPAERWEKIGLVDTEHKRALVYAGIEKAGVPIGEFLHIDFQAPYSDERYDQAVKALVGAGCEVIVIDSLSHAWEGEGGFLDLQDKYGGNFQAWAKVKPHIKNFIRTLTESHDVHIIATMRTKQDYQVEASDTGKLKITKLGLKPIQKDDLEYEFQINFMIDEKHVARATKDNSGLFEQEPVKLTPEVGHKLYQWLEEGVDVRAEEEKERVAKISYIQSLCETSTDIAMLVTELEDKAKLTLDKMPLKFVRKAYDLVEAKVKEVEAVEA